MSYDYVLPSLLPVVREGERGRDREDWVVTYKRILPIRDINDRAMKYDIYGRFFVEVTRESDRWVVYRIDQGRRLRKNDLVIPAEAEVDDLPRWLEDLLHEYALPDRTIKKIE
jgi:hypothetical protein